MLYWISLVKVICKNTAGVSLQYWSIKSWSERRLGPQELWECVQFSKVWAYIWRPTRTVVLCSTVDGCMCACTLRGRPPLLQHSLSDICVFRSGSALPELLCSWHLLWLLKPDPYVCWCMEAMAVSFKLLPLNIILRFVLLLLIHHSYTPPPTPPHFSSPVYEL